MKIALIQLDVTHSKEKNLTSVLKKIDEASAAGARLICLPECFNSPLGISYFEKYAEQIPGYTTNLLAEAAKKANVYVIGGSIPEKDEGKMFNTSTVFNPEGKMIAKHRKLHLFDCHIHGKTVFCESDVISTGSTFTTFSVDDIKVGVGICHDIRFPEMAQIYRQKGCSLIIYPSAFESVTGELLWKILQRGRAVDNQLFVGCVSIARNETSSYLAWGHSSLINPWGEVLCEATEKEEIVYADIDMKVKDEVREAFPYYKQRRDDLYCLKY